MNTVELLISELKRETEATRKVMERLPEDRFSWKPHEKSMSLGQLALHIACVPGGIANILDASETEVPTVPLPEAVSVNEILSALDKYTTLAEEKLLSWGEPGLADTWTLTSNGSPVLVSSRIDMVRTLMLNHWYHHRGQLTVYLRLLNVPVPGIYGPSADES